MLVPAMLVAAQVALQLRRTEEGHYELAAGVGGEKSASSNHMNQSHHSSTQFIFETWP